MENKYYKPTIEEFHVGFEYEAIKLKEIDMKEIPIGTSLQAYIDMNDLADEWIKLTWSDRCSPENNFNVLRDPTGIIDISVPDSIRVKYLDREDIVSLGWTPHDSNEVIYFKDNHMLLYREEEHEISIAIVDPSVDEDMMINLRSNEVFKITIKNKSELKRLLKQLRIQ